MTDKNSGAGDALANSIIDQNRVWTYKLSKFNPIRYLTPEYLSNQLLEFDYGTLEWPAQLLWEIRERDQTTVTVANKRRMKIEGFNWTIAVKPEFAGNPGAEKQKDRLKYCFDNMMFTSAIDQDFRRGLQGGFGQMSEAIGMKWQVHELIARPSTDGLTFTAIDCPLWFFENRHGRMRYIKAQGLWDGEELQPGAWMITRGPGLLKPTSIAYMFAHLPRQLWLYYCEAHSLPGIWGKTKAAQGTPQYDAMKTFVALAGTQNFRGVGGVEDMVEAIHLTAQGALPYEALIEAMEKHIMEMWQGGAMATRAEAGAKVGSSNQNEDAKCFEESDAQMIQETLNNAITPQVIEFNFGPGEPMMAEIRVTPKRKPDLAEINLKYGFATANGIPVGENAYREEAGLPAPEKGEELIRGPLQPQQPGADGLIPGQDEPSGAPKGKPSGAAANSRDHDKAVNSTPKVMDQLNRKTVEMLAEGFATSRQPLADRLLGITELPTPEAQRVAIIKLKKDLPTILHEMNMASASAISVLERASVASWLNGYADSTVATHAE